MAKVRLFGATDGVHVTCDNPPSKLSLDVPIALPEQQTPAPEQTPDETPKPPELLLSAQDNPTGSIDSVVEAQPPSDLHVASSAAEPQNEVTESKKPYAYSDPPNANANANTVTDANPKLEP